MNFIYVLSLSPSHFTLLHGLHLTCSFCIANYDFNTFFFQSLLQELNMNAHVYAQCVNLVIYKQRLIWPSIYALIFF